MAEGEAVESNDKGSADSLASPTTGRAPLSSLRCVLCYNSLASLTGTPKLMECLHSICETCLKIKIEMIKSANSTEFLGNKLFLFSLHHFHDILSYSFLEMLWYIMVWCNVWKSCLYCAISYSYSKKLVLIPTY